MLPIGGSRSQETSECQRSATQVELVLAWIGITSGWPSAPADAGWTCRSPNLRPSASVTVQVQGLLVAEEQHLVLHEGIVQLLELPIA